MDRDIIGSDWSTRQLREFIRNETQSINYKFIDYFASHEDPHPVVVAEFEKLKKLGTGNVEAEYIGLGLTNKTKAELIQQARALQEAQKADIYTDEAIHQYEEQEQKAYESFTQNMGANYGFNFTQDEYHDFVEAMGSLGDKISNLGLGSAEMVALYNEIKDTPKRFDFVQTFIDVERETKGQGMTTTDFIDMMYDRLT